MSGPQNSNHCWRRGAQIGVVAFEQVILQHVSDQIAAEEAEVRLRREGGDKANSINPSFGMEPNKAVSAGVQKPRMHVGPRNPSPTARIAPPRTPAYDSELHGSTLAVRASHKNFASLLGGERTLLDSVSTLDLASNRCTFSRDRAFLERHRC